MTETLPELTGTGPRVLPYDPFDPAFHSDPYAVYRTLRETSGNVIPTEAGYAVLGHRELSAVLRDPRFGRGDGAGVQDTYIPTSEGQSRVVMFMDPPDHTRLRSLINKAFTPRMVEAVRPSRRSSPPISWTGSAGRAAAHRSTWSPSTSARWAPTSSTSWSASRRSTWPAASSTATTPVAASTPTTRSRLRSWTHV